MHARLDEQRQVYLRSTGGRLFGKPSNSTESKYLLTGLLTCGAMTSEGTRCGATLTVVARGRRHRKLYQCLRSARGRRRGPQCPNTLAIPLPLADAAILGCIESTIFRPDVVRAAIEEAIQRLRPERSSISAGPSNNPSHNLSEKFPI